MKDLDDEQRLKRKQLVDAETKCLKDVDDRYNQEYAYWQNRLRSRKQKLEEDFKREELERSQFYQNVANLNFNANTMRTHSPSANHQHLHPAHHANGLSTNGVSQPGGVNSSQSSSTSFYPSQMHHSYIAQHHHHLSPQHLSPTSSYVQASPMQNYYNLQTHNGVVAATSAGSGSSAAATSPANTFEPNYANYTLNYPSSISGNANGANSSELGAFSSNPNHQY